MVKLAGVSRASFYRFDEDAGPGPDRDMELPGRNSADCAGMAGLRAATDHSRTTAARLDSEPEEGLPAHAGRQSVVFPETEVRSDDRFQP
jgi:hypothetical protein